MHADYRCQKIYLLDTYPRRGQAFAVTSNHPAHRTTHTGPDPCAYLPKAPSLQLITGSVTDGQPRPLDQLSKMFGVPGGQDVSPRLSWSGCHRGAHPRRARLVCPTSAAPADGRQGDDPRAPEKGW
jgi:hypothetical protein